MKTMPTSPRSHRVTRPAVVGAAASALFALPHHTDASIIYSGPQGFNFNAGTGSNIVDPTFDVNGDSNGDFTVRVSNRIPASLGVASFQPRAGRQVLGASGLVNRLASGALISAAAPGWTAFAALLRARTSNGFQNGLWLTSQTGFAGVRFDLGGGNYNYGWVRMKVDDLLPQDGLPDWLTIIDYAYESDANAPILAGQTVAAPEPTSTALLALAGAGAAALRRRRTAVSNI